MNRIFSICALLVAGVVVLVVSALAAHAVVACNGDMSSLPVPSAMWLLSGGMFGLAAVGRRANGG
jgi:hypothetical protein